MIEPQMLAAQVDPHLLRGILARELAPGSKLQAMTLMIHEPLESVLIETGRLDGPERFEIRRINCGQHAEINSALKSGTPVACRRSMVEHLSSCSKLKVGPLPAAKRVESPAAASKGRRLDKALRR
jgi:DNA-binding GntR family transcriptional regulator